MGVKIDRPADYGGDGVVVYMAKSVEEVDKARAAFEAAEIPVDLPEAAIEAMFAAGKSNLPIRVSAVNYKRAIDVIDEVFPPPEIELPPLPDEEAAAAAGADGGEAGGDEAAGRSGPELTRKSLDAEGPARRKAPPLKKIQSSILKVCFISAVSMILPGIGILAAGFGLYASIWCYRKLDEVVGGEKALPRAKFAMGLGGVALVWNLGLSAYMAWSRGWLG